MALYDEVMGRARSRMERMLGASQPTAFVDTFNELGGPTQHTYSGIPDYTVLEGASSGGRWPSDRGVTIGEQIYSPYQAAGIGAIGDYVYPDQMQEYNVRMPEPGPVGRETETQWSDPAGMRGYGLDVAADPLAYAGSVVPPLYSQYNPAGAYAEAGRTVPNYASDWARGMNQVAQPFGGMGAGDRLSGPSVVAPPRMPTEKEILDRGVMVPVNERDRSFSKIHGAYYTGADFGYEQGWPERLGVPQEYIDVYMAVPDEAKQYAHDNPTDAILQQFEEKYGFPLDVSIEISM